MESKAFVADTTSSPGSSFIPIKASPSYDSDIETQIKNNALKVHNSSSSSSSSISSSSDEDGGFVSGEEEFETASERPIVGDPDDETLEKGVEEEVFVDYDGSFVDSFVVGSSELKISDRPIAKVSVDDDDDEEVLESPKARVLEGKEIGGDGLVVVKESFLGELGSSSIVAEIGENPELGRVVFEKMEPGLNKKVNSNSSELMEESSEFNGGNKVVQNAELDEDTVEDGTVFEKEEMALSKPRDGEMKEELQSEVLDENISAAVKEVEDNAEVVKASVIVVGEIDQVSSTTQEPVGDGFIETEGGKFTPGGGLAVEANHLNLSGPGAVAVEEVKEKKGSANEEVELPVDATEKMDNGYDHIGHDDEEAADSRLVGVGEEFANSGGPVMSYDVQTSEVEPLELKNEIAGGREDDNDHGGAAAVDVVAEDSQEEEKRDNGTEDGEEKSETVIAEADSEAKHSEDVLKVAADQVGFGSTVKVVGRDGEKIQGMVDTPQSAETNSSQINHAFDSAVSYVLEDGVPDKNHLPVSPVSAEPSSISNPKVNLEAEDETKQHPDEGEIEGSDTDGDTDGMIFGSSEAAKRFLEELEQASGAGSHSGAESSHDHSQRIDGQIVTDSDEEVDTDEEGDGKELFDSAALAALLKAATNTGSDGGNITITSQDGSRLFSVERPAGLGSSLRSMKPASRPNRTNLFTPSHVTSGGDSENNLSEEEKKKLEKIQQLRVKFLRLVQRLGHSAEDSIAAQVLYRLALIAGRPTSQSFSLDAAKQTAMQLEADGKDDLNFSLNILVLGKTGVGKSATINSIFGEEKASTDAFERTTTTVKEISGEMDGVKIRVFDTPGLMSSVMEQGVNRKILSSIKKFTKKCPPDIVLYVDRLDTQTRDLNDLPLLKTITGALGPSIWRSAIVTLTHGASAPPDGPSGSPLSYEVFVAQRSHVVQQSIGQAVGDLRLMNPSLMNPVSLVENHPSCRKNRDGQKVLPNGQTWRPQLLLLCYSMKILSEASSVSKPQDPFDHRKLFGFRVRSPPLPYLLSWLLQSRTHPKLPSDQGGDNGDSDIDLDDLSDSDVEEYEDEYDQLPPFKPLRKSQLAKLNKEQRKAYFEEYDYRVKLLQKKQWKEELRRMKEIKKKGKAGVDEYYPGDDIDQENGSPAAVPVPLPDMVLPPSFDSDNPAYRYRFLEPTSQFLARPVLDTHGWDHDCGYDGVNLEQSLAIANRFPGAVAVQITKDKKEFNLHLDSSVSAKHGDNGSTMAGFDIQNIGKQLAYIVRGETKFNNLKKNKTAAGFSVTFLGENVATGFKLEDQITVGKRLVLVGSAGTVRSQGDVAYGSNVEVRLRESDFPIGQDQSTLGLSLVKWRGDLALGANLQSQFSIGRSSKVAVRVGLNNKLSGQITIRTSSSEQLQLALVGVLPVAMAIYKAIWPGVSENYPIY